MTYQLITNTPCNLTAAALLCLSLVACGGGGSDAPAAGATSAANSGDQIAALPAPATAAAPATTASSTIPSIPAAAPAATTPLQLATTAVATTAVANPAAASVPAAGNFSCGLNGAAGIESEVLQRLNALRASGAVCGTTGYAATGALAWNRQLLQAAAGHSTDMAQKNYFSHTSQDGRTAAQRVTAAGYIWSTVGENIAAGQTSVEQVMNGWARSPGHCQNLMNPNFRDVAVACVRNDAADYRLYWSMELGRSR